LIILFVGLFVLNSRTISVAFPSPDCSLDFSELPPGDPRASGILTVGVRVYDGYGGYTILSKPVYMVASGLDTSPAVLIVFTAGLVSAQTSSAQELLALVQGVASVVSSLPSNITASRSEPEQVARLQILSQSIIAIQSVVTQTAADDTSLVLDTLRTVTGSINLQLVSDDTTRASLLTVLSSLSVQVVTTLDTTIVGQYVINLRNMLSMTLVFTRTLTNPIVNRRLLSTDQQQEEDTLSIASNNGQQRSLIGRQLLATASTGSVRDSIDNIYSQLYATLESISISLLTAEGESHAFEQSGLSVTISRTRLPLLALPTTPFNSSLTLDATTDVLYSQTITAWISSWPSSLLFQSSNTAGNTTNLFHLALSLLIAFRIYRFNLVS
jgi:hypothetical protein